MGCSSSNVQRERQILPPTQRIPKSSTRGSRRYKRDFISFFFGKGMLPKRVSGLRTSISLENDSVCADLIKTCSADFSSSVETTSLEF